jgi:oxygen-independent coproporphyrinogen III oxidase
MKPSKELIQKYQQMVPRYTSYPPATSFKEQTALTFKEHIISSNEKAPHHISLYIHIPFCKQLCWYCGCNTSLCSGDANTNEYVEILIQEIQDITALLNKTRVISQIHFGGGTPSILPIEHIQRILEACTRNFTISKTAEIAMECNPANLTENYIHKLIALGFNRISLGIQDLTTKCLLQ